MKVLKKLLVLAALSLPSVGAYCAENVQLGNPLDGYFVENKGQFVDETGSVRNDVKYIYYSKDGKIAFTNNSLEFYFAKPDDKANYNKITRKMDAKSSFMAKSNLLINNATTSGIQANNDIDFHINYYLPQCPQGITNVKAFKEIRYADVYNNIDLVLSSSNSKLQYRFELKNGASLDAINQIDMSNLNNIATDFGKASINAPIVVNLSDNSRYQVNLNSGNTAKYTLINKSNVSLYQPADQQVILLSFFGGSNEDQFWRLKRDNNDNIIAIGSTKSKADFVPNASIGDPQKGGLNVFVYKMNSAGSQQWLTFIGGDNDDDAQNIAVNTANEIVIVGSTSSSNYPTKASPGVGVYQAAKSSDDQDDAFVTKIGKDGAIIWSTFYGSKKYDAAYAVACAPGGQVVFGGYTEGRTADVFPLKTPFQATYKGGDNEGFVAGLKSDGSDLIFSSYIGGGGAEEVRDMVTDAAGDIIAVGKTSSDNFTAPANNQPWQGTLNGGTDGFVVKLSPVGTLISSTYYGGEKYDELWAVDVDASNYIYATGVTSSSNPLNIASSDAFKPSYIGGSFDGFAVKMSINSTQTNRQWGTYIGAENEDVIMDLEYDKASKCVNIVGYELTNNSNDAWPYVVRLTGATGMPNADANQHLFKFPAYMTGTSGSMDLNAYNVFANSIVASLDGSQWFVGGETFAREGKTGQGDGFITIIKHNLRLDVKDANSNVIAQISPNPSNSGLFNVSLEKELTDCTYSVYDMLGAQIIAPLSFNSSTVIDLSATNSGVYMLEITSPTGTIKSKLIKQ